MKNLLFNFDDLSDKAKAVKQAAKYFSRAGANIVQTDATGSVRRSSGVSYRELTMTFADSQTATLRIKASGDIFQVLVNGKPLAIKNQDDHAQSIAEIVAVLDAGRAKFQKKLASAKVSAPAGIRTAAPKMQQFLTEKRDALKEAIAAVREEIAVLRGGSLAA